MLKSSVLAQYKNSVLDAASDMPQLTGNILMGFWHNWPTSPGQGYQQGVFAEMPLTDIPQAYNVIAVAFMKGNGVPTFAPYNATDAEFRAQVAQLNAQGRAVLISLGGADAHIELHEGQQEALAYEIIRLVEVYGFDGLDIDLEQSAITLADNRTVLPAALRMVREHYEEQGKHFIISMAPEFPYLRADGAYLAYIEALDDLYDFIAPQYYNQGGDGVWVDEVNLWITQNSDEHKELFLYYLTDSLIHGTRGFARIAPERLAIGLPTNNDAAATGYVIDPQDVTNALEKLRDAGNPVRGLMTWSVNWDDGKDKDGQPYGWEFANRYGYLTEGEAPAPDKPSVPAGFVAAEPTTDAVKLGWQLSSGSNPVFRYDLRRDGVEVGTTNAPPFTDTGLQPGHAYAYQIRATDVQGVSSDWSAVLNVHTKAEEGGGETPDWKEGVAYKVGDAVIHNRVAYTCEQVHTSTAVTAPDVLLWKPAARLKR